MIDPNKGQVSSVFHPFDTINAISLALLNSQLPFLVMKKYTQGRPNNE